MFRACALEKYCSFIFHSCRCYIQITVKLFKNSILTRDLHTVFQGRDWWTVEVRKQLYFDGRTWTHRQRTYFICSSRFNKFHIIYAQETDVEMTETLLIIETVKRFKHGDGWSSFFSVWMLFWISRIESLRETSYLARFPFQNGPYRKLL
jgi:hypothetical protein